MNARGRILQAVDRALAGLDLATLVERALVRERRTPIRVIAIGKGAHAMFEGARQALGSRIEDAVIVGPEDAGHPLPDARSVRAGKRCLELVSRAGDALVLALVSGGGSALVCAPAPGITLAKKRAVTRALLESGATIQEINVVRKHLSLVKGGGLARAAAPRSVLTLVAVDVIAGDASDVASSPTLVDETTVAQARAVLRRWAPRFADLPLARTLSGDPSSRLQSRVLVAPHHLARAVARELDGKVLAPSQASAIDLAAEYVARARRMAPGTAFVRAAEPSIVVAARGGRGGRSTHLAALVARDLPRGVTFAAVATDGVDGSSGTAGAVVDARLRDRADLDDAIARFDTGTLHRRAGTAIAGAPTGHNLADLHVLIR